MVCGFNHRDNVTHRGEGSFSEECGPEANGGVYFRRE